METEAKVSKAQDLLAMRGVTRRDFMKLCGAVAAAAGLSSLAIPRIAQALENSVIGATEGNLYPVIWLEGASCSGCTESFAQNVTPDPAQVVLELISLNYCETLSAAAGWSAEEAKEQTIKAGNYIVVYEGAVLTRWDGQALRIADTPGMTQLEEAAENATAVVAVGSCAVNGGWMGANPNSSDAMGVQKYLSQAGIDVPVINIPGCPVNPEWFVSVLVDVLMLDQIPELNSMNMPTGIYDQTIHDNCERRGHFENGEFVYEFGSEEEAKGYCLYAMGCRGPQTKANCGVVLWNDRRSWCIQAGSPCIGCCEANPNDPGHNWFEVNTPFRERLRGLRIGDWMVQPTTIALAITGIVAACLIIHGFGMKLAGRMGGGAEIEKVRKWDEKHPDESIGQYEYSIYNRDKNDDTDEEGR